MTSSFFLLSFPVCHSIATKFRIIFVLFQVKSYQSFEDSPINLFLFGTADSTSTYWKNCNRWLFGYPNLKDWLFSFSLCRIDFLFYFFRISYNFEPNLIFLTWTFSIFSHSIVIQNLDFMLEFSNICLRKSLNTIPFS